MHVDYGPNRDVCFAVNPENEQEAARLLRELAPEIAVTTSAEVLPQIKEYERTSTTVVNAYVKPLVRHYLGNLDGGLARTGYAAPLRVMLSNGGLGSTETATDFPLRLIESGPVAGAIVGRQIAQALGLPEVLSFDMGGTTAKACLIRDGAMPITDELEVARSRRFTRSSGFPVAVPAVNMIEIGAGGGSIAGINAMGLVQVGPESSGADPGPICYGRGGTRPTVTDADLLLGYLDPDNFAGGSMRLDEDAARDGIAEHLARPRGQPTATRIVVVKGILGRGGRRREVVGQSEQTQRVRCTAATDGRIPLATQFHDDNCRIGIPPNQKTMSYVATGFPFRSPTGTAIGILDPQINTLGVGNTAGRAVATIGITAYPARRRGSRRRRRPRNAEAASWCWSGTKS